QKANSRAESERPTERMDQQTQIARVANEAINAVGHQRMPRLDRHEPAEPAAQYEYRPQPQCPAGGEKRYTGPAQFLTVKLPEFLSVGVRRQVGAEPTDNRKNCDYPAVRPILPLARTQIAAAEKRYACERAHKT